MDLLLGLLSTAERNIGIIHRHRNEFELAESYCQQALSHARLYKGKTENKSDLLCIALRTLHDLRGIQSNFIDALPFVEEAYDLVAIAYNPVHPQVQEAAGALIECLIHKGDLYDAKRFAEATLDSLKDPANGLDQESEAVAGGYYNLANVINQQKGDLVKAKMLARESFRIRTRVHGNNHVLVGISCHLLGSILMHQDNLGDETMELFERSLANDTKNYGPDGTNTAVSNLHLGAFYNQLANRQQTDERKMAYLHLSKSKFEEAVRIYTKVFGSNNPQSIHASSQLSIILHKLSEA
jgi:tetratricopeptide (TPR) repeat protein